MLHLALGSWMLSYFKTGHSSLADNVLAGITSGAGPSAQGTAIDWGAGDGGGSGSSSTWEYSSVFFNNDEDGRYSLWGRLMQSNTLILFVPFLILGGATVRGSAACRLVWLPAFDTALCSACCPVLKLLSSAQMRGLPPCSCPQLLYSLAASAAAAFGVSCWRSKEDEGLPPFSRAAAQGLLQGGSLAEACPHLTGAHGSCRALRTNRTASDRTPLLQAQPLTASNTTPT